jgi:predicted RNA-binding protein YlxR (DUF448 family)
VKTRGWNNKKIEKTPRSIWVCNSAKLLDRWKKKEKMEDSVSASVECLKNITKHPKYSP